MLDREELRGLILCINDSLAEHNKIAAHYGEGMTAYEYPPKIKMMVDALIKEYEGDVRGQDAAINSHYNKLDAMLKTIK